MGMMINRRRVYGGKKSLLPSGYTQLEYIENTSNAYIDTLYAPPSLSNLVIKVKVYINNADELNDLVSNQIDNYNDYAFILGRSVNSKLFLYYGNIIKSNSVQSYPLEIEFGFVNSNGKYNVYFKENSDTIQALGTNFILSPLKIILFTRIQEGGKMPLKGRMYYCTIETNGESVRNFIPCKNPQNVVGMYDLVEGKFYSSSNGTAFVAGPKV
jgi:hypothetical protein